MHPVLFVPLAAAIVAAVMASAISVRDPGQPTNRLIALILVCSCWWSLCEVVWGMADEARTVRMLIKASSLGWLWLGPLCLHVLVEIAGNGRLRLRRLLPWAYASAVAGIVLYVATPWCVGEPVRTSWGWGVTFGPLFPLAFAPTFLAVNATLVMIPHFFPRSVSPGERREALWLVAGIAVPLGITTLTDVALPLAGIQVPRLGSASIVMVGVLVARSLSRNGYFLLAPAPFTTHILEALQDGVALVELDGRIHTGNRGLARLCGVSVDALPGLPLEALLPDLGSDPTRLEVDREIDLIRVDGETVPTSVSVAPLRDEDGVPVGRALAVQDLREVEALRGRLVTAGRLAAVGELAAGIAHEINPPITFVRSNLGLLQTHWATLCSAAEKLPADPSLESLLAEGGELFEESIEGVERVASIARDVAAFSHAGLGDPERVDLNEVLENAVNVAALSYSVLVERRYGELPPVVCDPQQLKQVFLNLLLNALQAVGDYGRIRLVTAPGDGTVSVRVEDDGCGIEAEALERIFDPFFTTRPAEATGLGLAHCYQIVKNHGGRILVESTPRRGSRFEIELPLEPPGAE